MVHSRSRRRLALAVPAALALTASLGFLPQTASAAVPPAATARAADGPSLAYVVNTRTDHRTIASVQRAISADEDAIKRLATNYIESVRAYTQHERVRNRYTGRDEDPDERLMRSIEEKIDIPDSRKDDFRQEIMNYIGALALDGKKFEYNTNARLLKALELKLFEDQRDTIKLKNLVSSVVDDETQQKIDVVKQRLIKYFGYNETSATDVLNYVASIFARGDSKQDD